MLGMTGYSYKELTLDKICIVTEIKSVNSRFLDIEVNLPYYLNSLELNIRNLIKERLNRGKIVVNVSIKEIGMDYDVDVNFNLVKQYIKSLNQIIEKFDIKDEIRLFHLIKFNDIFLVEKENDYKKYWVVIEKSLNENIDEVLLMKKKEGEALKEDLLNHLKDLRFNISVIESNIPKMEEEIFKNTKEKIKELIGENIDEVRLLNEVAFLVNRSCINEEVVRFKSYIEQFKSIMDEGKDVGKRLDFICQEMHREINTIGTKITLVELTHNVVTIKNTIEKMREQLRNIE